MSLTSPAPFVPVSLEWGAEPQLLWGDLGGLRFTEPFFDQTIERWAGGEPPPSLASSRLDALEPFAAAPELDPDLLVFHLSRCGSTLVSRLLATDLDALVIVEPAPVNALLLAPGLEPRLLRLLMRALGQRRFGERRYALKLSSWNVMRLDLFRSAFPAAKLVFVVRDPMAVIASILKAPPAWLSSEAAAAIFGAPVSGDLGVRAVGALAAMLKRIREALDDGTLLVDYRELPDAVWREVVPFAGWAADANRVTRMREEARFSAKLAGRSLFTPDRTAPDTVPERLQRLAAELVLPLYDALSPP